jgi:hypothetical protein
MNSFAPPFLILYVRVEKFRDEPHVNYFLSYQHVLARFPG